MSCGRSRRDRPLMFLMGPTGAGKTELALQLVRRYPFEIISVDSAMIYRGMDIGTAKPGPEVLARAPHRLIDIRDPAETYSAAEFRSDALREIEDILAMGRIPLLVGGTGLYFRALERGLAALPPASAALRRELAQELSREGPEHLHRRLAAIDPVSAERIHPRDPQRIVRALEVCELTGRPLSELLGRDAEQPLPYAVCKLVLAPADRSALHARLERRFHRMLAAGLVDEVEALYAREDLHAELPAMRVVGYRQVWRYLAGECDYEHMVHSAVTATRRLAKRQITWFRAEARARWIDSTAADPAGEFSAHLEASKLFER